MEQLDMFTRPKKTIQKAYKFRLYPNEEQKIFLEKTFGCCRLIYNSVLGDKIDHYEKTGETLKVRVKDYRDKYEFMKEVDSDALGYELRFLDVAYKNFFRDKSVGFPRFKSKKDNHKSFTMKGRAIKIEGGKVSIPKLRKTKAKDNRIRIVAHQEVEGRMVNATISKTPSGKYFISIMAEVEIEELPTKATAVGIDLGLTDFAILSNGKKVKNPKWLRKSEERLKKLQRDLSRKKKGSKNRDKARIKVAKQHEKVANQRKYFLQTLSTEIIRENQTIVIEDLKVSNMIKNRNLAKYIGEVSWAEFRRQLEYKAAWYGREIIVAPSNFASSQLCSKCGFKNKAVKNLAVRQWTCPECGADHDRDINASQNLLNLALKEG